MLANMYLLIKVHKKNFPGRAVVSQIDDPTYNICKELTKILQPISSAGKSYIKNTYALKAMLSDINLDEDCLMASLDIVGLYPSVPVKKALEIVRKKLEEDETLQSRTEWKVDDIMILLGHKLMVVRLENLYLGKLQKFTWIGLRKIMCLQSKMIFKSFSGKGCEMMFS